MIESGFPESRQRDVLQETGERSGLMKMLVVLIIVMVSLMYTVQIGPICTVNGTLIVMGWAKVSLQLFLWKIMQ